MNKLYLALRLHKNPHLRIKPPINIVLPEGCGGISFIFKTKKAAMAFEGKKVGLLEVTEVPLEEIDNGD